MPFAARPLASEAAGRYAASPAAWRGRVAHPQAAAAIFVEHPGVVVAQGARVLRIVPVAGEGAGGTIETAASKEAYQDAERAASFARTQQQQFSGRVFGLRQEARRTDCETFEAEIL